MKRITLPTTMALALALVPSAARADLSGAAFMHGGASPEASGGDWGIGGHAGWEFFDMVMVGIDVRFNQVPQGLGGTSQEAPAITAIARGKLSFWKVQPYLSVRGGIGFWSGVLNANTGGGAAEALVIGGEVGVLIEMFSGLYIRFGVDLTAFNGNFTVERVHLANGVAGVEVTL